MSKKKSEASTQSELSDFPKLVPHKRIQTAEGWRRSQLKLRKSSSKSASKG